MTSSVLIVALQLVTVGLAAVVWYVVRRLVKQVELLGERVGEVRVSMGKLETRVTHLEQDSRDVRTEISHLADRVNHLDRR